MKRTRNLILAALICSSTAMAGPLDDMSRRLFGNEAERFSFTLTPDSTETYCVTADNGHVQVNGSSTSAMAVGLNRYLRELCGTDVSWYAADPVVLPADLPSTSTPLTGSAKTDSRFFLNYCTYGYSTPYWKWNDWQRLIDWMALQGVNMPLAIAGQEAVWQRVWRSFGLDDETIRSYFTGPAHLPWHRMLNVDRWDGPLPQSYIDSQEALQKQIVERMRQLGMKPILPAFAGHVPPALGKVFPNVKIHPMSKWGGLDPDKYRSYFIEPSEALFDSIQSRFIAEQTRTFGTDHIYGLDPFNEIEVPSWEPDYLRSASRRIFSTLEAADPEAQWLQMAWMFYYMNKHWTPERIEAFLSGVEPDKLILLDYYCDFKPLWPETNAFHGRKFIWCYLGNFGGNSFIVGDMDVVNDRIDNVFDANLSNLDGVGGTLEGLDLNRNMHSFVLDKAWNHNDGPANPSEWIAVWAKGRGADDDAAVGEAWQRLYRDIYRSTSLSQGTLINARPVLEGYGRWTTNNNIKYDNDSLWQIWKMLIDARTSSPQHDFDIVNVGRQVLGNNFVKVRDAFTEAFRKRDIAAMQTAADNIDTYIADFDELLGTVPAFSLGKWLDDARSTGRSEGEADYYEMNARHLITTWAQTPGSLIDYANRDLYGLADSFYRVRWRLFTDALIDVTKNGGDWQDNKEPFYYTTLSDFEGKWNNSHDTYPLTNGKKAVDVARKLYEKYAQMPRR